MNGRTEVVRRRTTAVPVSRFVPLRPASLRLDGGPPQCRSSVLMRVITGPPHDKRTVRLPRHWCPGGGDVGLPGEVALDNRKRRPWRQPGTALEIIGYPADALPAYRDTGSGRGDRGGSHLEDRECVGRVGASSPFLLIVHAVTVCVGSIRRAVEWQVVVLEPGVGNRRTGPWNS